MTEYSYDETGVYFSFFIASILSLLLLPYTYKFFFSSSGTFEENCSCSCSACREKFTLVRKREHAAQRNSRLITGIILFLGWIIYVVQVHRIFTTVISPPNLFDPWLVLGVEKSADKTAVKKAYYQLSRTHHPDKVPLSEVAEANKKFALISRAYTTLTNDEARKRFEDWGDPDGKQFMSMGIALPLWLVDSKSSPIVILGYCLLFGILLPWSISKWWYRNRRFTRDRVLFETMTTFFRALNQTSGMTEILNILCKASEWAESFPYVPELDDKFMGILETALTASQEQADGSIFPPEIASDPQAKKIWLILLGHFCRTWDVLAKDAIQSPTEENSVRNGALATVKSSANSSLNPISGKFTASEFKHICMGKDRVVVLALHLLKSGIIQITTAHDWLYQTIVSIDISQQLVQAMFQSLPLLIQVPHVDLLCADRVRKDSSKPVRNVEDLALSLTKAERNKLFPGFSKAQLSDVNAFLTAFPRLIIERLCFKVVGENAVSPGSLVTCVVGISLVSSFCNRKIFSFSDVDDEQPRDASGNEKTNNEEDVLEFESEGDGSGGRRIKLAKRIKAAHAPRFGAEKSPSWWVILGIPTSNRIISAENVTDLESTRTVLLRFQAPQSVGEYQFRIYILSDHFLGTDVKIDRTLTVIEQPRVEFVEDDISEPDEETLSGQMAIMRGHGSKKKVRGNAMPKSSGGMSVKKPNGASSSDDSSSDDDD